MKKMNEKLLAGVLAVSALAGTMITTAAHAEVSAAVGVGNMYYWRGLDLGDGDAAVWGDLKASSDVGIYGGVWTSSGDSAGGTEFDLYLGYGAEFGDFGIDISYWSYVYPEIELAAGDLAEIVLALSYGPVVLTYYDNQEGSDLNYTYTTLAVSAGDFTIKYGVHAEDENIVDLGEFLGNPAFNDIDATGSTLDGYSHLDITYAFNDNLSFTLGNVIDNAEYEVAGTVYDVHPDDPKVSFNYTLPIE
jgi:uncharacterized protein (TIGR02001 family)